MAECSESGCSRKPVAQGLCRKHYDAARASRRLVRVANSGRPPKPVVDPGDGKWYSDDPVTKRELFDLAKRQAFAILKDPDTPKDLRVSIFRIVKDWEVEDEEPEGLAELRELRGRVLGFGAD